MKTKKYIKYNWSVLLALLLLLSSSSVMAQKAKEKMTDVSSIIVDVNGDPIVGAVIFANEGADVVGNDAEGKFTVATKPGAVILIEAEGYESYTWKLSENPALANITMLESVLLAGEKDEVILPLQHSVKQRYIVGSVSTIDGAKLEKYSDPLLSNTLQGQASGLTAVMTSGGMANNPANIYVRGLSRPGSNQPIYIVDGIERLFDDLNPEEIASIEILKDATAKILYGARAANGVVLVRTRRGVANKRTLTAKVEYGIGQTTRMPEFLDSYNYASLYNVARENDGLAPLYTSDDLDGYANSTGENDVLYPNVDSYDRFLREFTNYAKAATEVSGGNDVATYALMLGYMGYKGLQTEGPTPRQDRFNVRANLDVNISKQIKGHVNLATIIDRWQTSGVDHWSTFNSLSTHRPNEYPLLIDESYIAKTERGVPAFGGSYLNKDNLLAELAYGGEGINKFINQQLNVGLDFDMNKWVDGLTAKATIAFDNYISGNQNVAPTAATYAPAYDAQADSVSFTLLRSGVTDVTYGLSSNETSRRTAFTGQLAYNKEIGAGVLDASLGYFYYLLEQKGGTQDVANANTYLRANYIYNDKYVVEGNLSYVGSNRFMGDNKHFLSTALGAAWLLSEEDFMQNSGFDFLKLKASWGLLGYDAATSYYMQDNWWSKSGSMNFGEQNQVSYPRTLLNTYGNPDLEWERSSEFNVGVEGILLDRRLRFETNYFNETRSNIIDIVKEDYSDIYGDYMMATNHGIVANQGVELEVDWMDTNGDFSYCVGLNLTYAKNKVVETDEVYYSDERMNEGKPSDVIMGYESLGLFGKDVDISTAAMQDLGYYQVGDIAYKDQNNDNTINDLDKVAIGNTVPRTQFGLDIDLKYKNWGFYALGTASLGVYQNLTNAYYRNNGEGKYSTLALDAYHPVSNTSGDQPRLTTTAANNNTVNSDFWTKRADFFRLKNVELSYTFDLASSAQRKVKVYTRANNLFVISSIKDLDPEATGGGVTNYPVLRTIVGGVSFSF